MVVLRRRDGDGEGAVGAAGQNLLRPACVAGARREQRNDSDERKREKAPHDSPFIEDDTAGVLTVRGGLVQRAGTALRAAYEEPRDEGLLRAVIARNAREVDG